MIWQNDLKKYFLSRSVVKNLPNYNFLIKNILLDKTYIDAFSIKNLNWNIFSVILSYTYIQLNNCSEPNNDWVTDVSNFKIVDIFKFQTAVNFEFRTKVDQKEITTKNLAYPNLVSK